MVYRYLEILKRQTRGPVGFDEVVSGYDFGFLTCGDIQNWILQQGLRGPLCQALCELAEEDLACFERLLWAACFEATGKKVPRPGEKRWSLAQDRWRVALLKEALDGSLNPEHLGEAVEDVYEWVGCPEDMLHLWSCPKGQKTPVAHRQAIEAFIATNPWAPMLPATA